MKSAEPDFVFVVGCGHSGTSLMTAMLGAHSAIYAIPVETGIFCDDLPPDEARRQLWVYARRSDKPGARRICEKTPRHIRVMDRMIAAFPAAKTIILVRDPRDVVASLKRRRGNLQGLGQWEGANTAALEWLARSPAAIRLVHYEELVREPPRVLTEVCAFLDLPYEAGMLDYWKDDRIWFGLDEDREFGEAALKQRSTRNAQLHEPVKTDRIGAYRNELDAAEIERICTRLAPLAARFGYELTP